MKTVVIASVITALSLVSYAVYSNCTSRVSKAYAGSCGQPQVVKTDGTQCPAPSAPDSNTCSKNNDPTATITGCATVWNFFASYNGMTFNTPAGATSHETGWFETVVACCSGGINGTFGSAKKCCQVAPGESPQGCPTPCGPGGKNGCAVCWGPQPGASCTIDADVAENNDCQGDGAQYTEKVIVTLAPPDGGCDQ